MDLGLIRHGHAEPFATHLASDAERPLTPLGRDLLSRAAPLMRERGIAPAIILSSPYLRARQTAELLQSALMPAEGMLVLSALASGARPETLLEIATDHQALKSVMIVGHNPEIGAAVQQLAARAGADIGPMMPGTLALFRNANLPPDQPLTLAGQWQIESWTVGAG